MSVGEQQAIDGAVGLLEQRGPGLGRDRWQAFYERTVPLADRLYDQHLTELESEGAT